MTLSPFQIKQIKSYLQTVMPTVEVCPPRKSNQGDYALAIFKDKKSYDDYVFNGYDTEDYIMYQTDGEGPGDWWGFSYNVHYPGVMYRSDMSGEPDYDEMTDHKEIFLGLKKCLLGLMVFIQAQNNESANRVMHELAEFCHDDLEYK